MKAGITFETAGDGLNTIVFLHGIGADASSFHHQMDLDGATTFAWNMPGYQGSPSLGEVTFESLSDALMAFLDDLAPVHLVGQSIGGMIALEHALRHPKQVQSLTLIATTPRFGGRDPAFAEAFLKARLGPLDQGLTMAQMAKKTAPHLVGPNTSQAEIDHIEQALARVPQSTWRDILKCLVTFDRADDLDQITCPTLVVAGTYDQNAPVRTMEKMAAKIPNAQFHTIEGAGHMPHQEQPAQFNEILADFLRTLPK